MVEGKLQNGFAGRIRSLFNGRSTISSQSFTSSVVSPKSPATRLGLSVLSSPTIDLPGLPSHLSPPSRAPLSPHLFRGATSPTGMTVAALPSARSRWSHSTVHPPSSSRPRSQPNSPRRNWDWEHVRTSSGGTRRRRTRRMKHGRPQGVTKGILREKAGRVKLIRCLGLGILLGVGLTVYLALALSDVINGLNVHIFMIVVGLVLVMAFAHAAVRLCMYILRPPQYPISRATSNAAVAPEEPIHVILRRDEEEFSDEETDSVPKDAVLPAPPPVYGLWRGSTRMDPNLVHWRRAETLQREGAPPERTTPNPEQPSSPYRPPSYATEDGVRYVLEAEPRSIAPEANSEAFSVHPSERGRIASGVL